MDDLDPVTAAAPSLATRTPALLADLDDLVAATTRPRRRRLRVVAGLAVGTVALGAGSAAAGVLPTSWFDRPDALHQEVVLSSGARCALTYAARTVESGAVARADADAAMRSARDFLAHLGPVPVAPAVERYEEEQRRLEATPQYQALPPAERGPVLQGDDLELTALAAEVNARVAADLDRRGLVSAVVSVAQAVRCDG